MAILSANTLKFYKADKSIFDVDRRKAGAVAKALLSKPAPTIINKKDTRYTLLNKRCGQNSTNCSWTNSSHPARTGVSRTQTEPLSISYARKHSLEAAREASDKGAHSEVTLEDDLDLAAE